MSRKSAVIFLIAAIIAGLWFLRSETPSAPVSFIPKEDEPAPIPVKETPPEPAAATSAVPVAPVAQDTLPELSIEQVNKKRAEAKMSLAFGYSASRAFHAEFGRYSTDLKALGWQPPESWIDYKLGFAAPFEPKNPADTGQITEDPRRMDTDVYLTERNQAGEAYAYRGPAGGLRLSDYSKYCEAGCTAGEEGFEMMIAVPLDDYGRVDVWTINHKKEMKMVLDGYPKR